MNTITITRSGTLGRLQSEIYIVNVSFESGKLKVLPSEIIVKVVFLKRVASSLSAGGPEAKESRH